MRLTPAQTDLIETLRKAKRNARFVYGDDTYWCVPEGPYRPQAHRRTWESLVDWGILVPTYATHRFTDYMLAEEWR